MWVSPATLISSAIKVPFVLFRSRNTSGARIDIVVIPIAMDICFSAITLLVSEVISGAFAILRRIFEPFVTVPSPFLIFRTESSPIASHFSKNVSFPSILSRAFIP